MARYPRAEILAAFERYKRARDEASRTGDWNVWADCFTPDAGVGETGASTAPAAP